MRESNRLMAKVQPFHPLAQMNPNDDGFANSFRIDDRV